MADVFLNFSIVITTKNRLNLLKRAIDSVLSQTVPCEIIVADDCSTDGTEEYCRSLESRVTYYRNSSNPSRSVTVNAGVRIAKGDWIKLLDDDDYLTSDCIEEMTEAIAKHPQAVICFCQAINVDRSGKEKSRTMRSGPGKVFYIPQEDIHYGMLLELLPFGVASQVAFRKDVFFKSGGWDVSLKDATPCDEVDSYIRICQFGDAIFINRYLIYHTLWLGSYNIRFSLKERLDRNILMKKKMYNFIKERHRQYLPSLNDIEEYLKLHWGLVALKHGRIPSAAKIALPAVFSCRAWKLLFRAFLARQRNYQNPNIRKIVLL